MELSASPLKEPGGLEEKRSREPQIRRGHLTLCPQVRRSRVEELALLVERCRRGEREAFEALIEACKGQVYGLAWRILGNGADADDVAQETFLRVFLRLKDLREPRAFPRWLSRITANLALQKIHQRRPWVELDQMDAGHEQSQGTPDDDPQRAVLALDLRGRINGAMDALSAEQRTVLALRDIQGYAYQEVAEILEVPLGTVKSRLNAARRCLREAIRKDGKGPLGPLE